MKLIIGGAFQGKMVYARERFGFGDGDIFTCSTQEVDFSKPCIYALEEFVYACIQKKTDPVAYIREHRAALENTVVICQDIFCGVVPMDAELRNWRHTTGKLCQYLSREAEEVTRVICGLEQRLK